MRSPWFTLYASRDLGDDYYLRGMAAYGRNDAKTTRHDVGGIAGLTAHGDYAADQYSAQAELGRAVRVGGIVLSPQALVSYTFYNPGNYTETGAGGADLQVDQKALNNLDLGIGLAASTTYEFEDGKTLTPEVRTGVRVSAIRGGVESTSRFTGGGSAFDSQGPSLPRTSGNIGASLTYSPAADLDIKVSYDYEFKDHYQAHAGYIQSSYKF